MKYMVETDDSDCPQKPDTGTGKYYFSKNEKSGSKKGRININSDVASLIDFKNGEKIFLTWYKEKRELYVKILTFIQIPLEPDTGTGSYYFSEIQTDIKQGRANLNTDIANIINFVNGEKLLIKWCKEKRQLCIKPLTY